MNLKITPKTLGLSIENRNLRDKTLFILKINCICTFSPQLFFSKKLGRQKKKILEKDVISRIKSKKKQTFLMDRGEVFRAHPCTEVQCTRQQGYFFSLRRPSISVIDDDSSLLFPSSAVAEHNSYTFWIDSKHILHLGTKKKFFFIVTIRLLN
jgi:hypothetical protein